MSQNRLRGAHLAPVLRRFVLLGLLLVVQGFGNGSLPVGTIHSIASPYIGTGTNTITAMAALASDDIWVVGASGQAPQTLLAHWDGAHWRVTPGPSPPARNALLDISAVGPDDIWAVGTYDTEAYHKPLFEHWDSWSWQVEHGPEGMLDGVLHAVVAVTPQDVWAAGDYQATGRRTLLEHWDGQSWSVVESLNCSQQPDRSSNVLNGLAATGANDVWAVGACSSPSGTLQALIEHWDGLKWAIVPVSGLDGGWSALKGVTAISGDNAWAAGEQMIDGAVHTLFVHWDGHNWSHVESPSVGKQGNHLARLAAVNAQDVWAVGYFDNSAYGQLPLIEHWDGHWWTWVPTPIYGESNIAAVAAIAPRNIWFAGAYRRLDSGNNGNSRTLVARLRSPADLLADSP